QRRALLPAVRAPLSARDRADNRPHDPLPRRFLLAGRLQGAVLRAFSLLGPARRLLRGGRCHLERRGARARAVASARDPAAAPLAREWGQRRAACRAPP